jgi:hypothetical protein
VVRVDAVLVNPVLDLSWYYRIAHSFVGVGADLQLLVVLRDSQNGDYLHHVAVPLTVGNMNSKDTGPGYWNYMRLVFSRVARQVRYALDDGPTADRL